MDADASYSWLLMTRICFCAHTHTLSLRRPPPPSSSFSPPPLLLLPLLQLLSLSLSLSLQRRRRVTERPVPRGPPVAAAQVPRHGHALDDCRGPLPARGQRAEVHRGPGELQAEVSGEERQDRPRHGPAAVSKEGSGLSLLLAFVMAQTDMT